MGKRKKEACPSGRALLSLAFVFFCQPAFAILPHLRRFFLCFLRSLFWSITRPGGEKDCAHHTPGQRGRNLSFLFSHFTFALDWDRRRTSKREQKKKERPKMEPGSIKLVEDGVCVCACCGKSCASDALHPSPQAWGLVEGRQRLFLHILRMSSCPLRLERSLPSVSRLGGWAASFFLSFSPPDIYAPGERN